MVYFPITAPPRHNTLTGRPGLTYCEDGSNNEQFKCRRERGKCAPFRPAGDEPFIVERTGVSNDNFMSKSTKFTVKGHNFRRQFSHLYFKRLEALQPRVSQQTKRNLLKQNMLIE